LQSIIILKCNHLKGKDSKPVKSGQTNQTVLLMNESLEGHSGEIASITWNDKFNKLTTADSNGKIIVWINYEGSWCEEMVNKRDNTTITGMKWSPDGQHICIIYNDGMSILSSSIIS
jgi:WD repeat-containing protein 35